MVKKEITEKDTTPIICLQNVSQKTVPHKRRKL
jgi:hypothetical protein